MLIFTPRHVPYSSTHGLFTNLKDHSTLTLSSSRGGLFESYAADAGRGPTPALRRLLFDCASPSDRIGLAEDNDALEIQIRELAYRLYEQSGHTTNTSLKFNSCSSSFPLKLVCAM